jgi:hypothetical protein
MCAVTAVEPWQRDCLPKLTAHIKDRLTRMPQLMASVHPLGEAHRGKGGRGLMSLLTRERLARVLSRMLDESEFLSDYGIRSLSRYHLDHPYSLMVGRQEYRVGYLPAESDSGVFGGNSNWRGPVWMPVNIVIIRALLQYYLYHGDDFRIECPTGSGRMMNLFEVAKDLAGRLAATFLRDPTTGRRPVYGATEKFQTDPHWRDYLLFYEYFHGDNGAGIGASHQTGWTGLVAKTMEIFRTVDAATYLAQGRRAGYRSAAPVPAPAPAAAAKV